MNADLLTAELQQAYYLVKEAVKKIQFDNIVEYDMFLAAGFRSAWASSWQRAGRIAPTAERSNTQNSGAECGTAALGIDAKNTNASIDVPGRYCKWLKSNLSPLEPPCKTTCDNCISHELPAPAGAGAGAQCFLAQLLRTRALTASQYKALCSTCAIPQGSYPNEQDVMRLDFKQVVQVLCGGR